MIGPLYLSLNCFSMLKKFVFALLLLFTCSVVTFAQTTEREAEEDLDYYSDKSPANFDDGRLGSQIWWGTGAQLGFNSNNFESFFQIGLSPIVGYKINQVLSVGPRGSFAYNSYRQTRTGGDFKASFVTWSAGAFARAKVFGQFFAHGEYSLLNEVEGFNGDDAIRATRAVPFLGGGISQGGGPGQAGFEILILFRLTAADRIGDSPFQFRSGLNFNF